MRIPYPDFHFTHLVSRHQRHWHVVWQLGQHRRRTRMLGRMLWHHRDGHQFDEPRWSGSVLLSKRRQRDDARLYMYDAPLVVLVDRKHGGKIRCFVLC